MTEHIDRKCLKRRHEDVASGRKADDSTTKGNAAMSLTVKETLEAWTRLWNGELDLAHAICDPEFTIYFGRADENGNNPADQLTGPQALADFIDTFRVQRPGIVYSNVRHIVGDDHGVSLWNADWETLHVGGIDVFSFTTEGMVERVWSVTAQRHILA